MSSENRPDRRDTLIGGLWFSASNVLPMLGTAVLSVVMGRILGATELGTQSLIAYVSSLISALLVSAFTSTSIQVLAARYGARDETGFAHVGRWSFWSQTITGTVSAVILAGIGAFSSDPLPWFIVALNAFIDGIAWGYATRITGVEGWTPVARLRLAWLSLAQILGIAAVLAGWGINGVFLGNVVASLGLLITLARSAPRLQRATFAPVPKEVFGLLGMFFVLTVLTQLVSRRIEFLFLGAFSTDQQVAMYSVAFMVVSSAATIPITLFGAAVPAVANRAADEPEVVDQHMGTALRVTLAASIPLTAAIATLGPPLIRLLFGAEFDEAATLIPLLSLTVLLVPIGSILSTYWTGVGSLRPVVVAMVTGGLIDVALAWSLVPHLDAWGAAIANVSGQLITAAMLVILSRRNGLHFRFDAGKIVLGLVVGAVAAACAFAAVRLLGNLGGLLVGGVLIVAVVAFAGRFIGLLSPGDSRWLREVMPVRLALAVSLVGGGH